MKVGCCAKIEEYSLVCEEGFDYIELAGKAIYALSDGLFNDLCAKIESGSLPCLALNAYCSPDIVIAGPGFDREKAREYARRLALRANALGVKVVNIGSPMSRRLPPDFSHEEAGRQIRFLLSDAADEFARYGINVNIEALGPCYCNFINKVSEAVDIAKDVSKNNLGIVLDFYNMQHSGEADMDLSDILPYIRHVHVSDDAGDPSRRSFLAEDRFGVHKNRLRSLKALGYDKNISIEIDIPFEREAAQKSRHLIRGIWV